MSASLGLVDGSSTSRRRKYQNHGFDPTGETPPEGRNDITGHLTDDLSWVIGKHQIKLGGEFRQAQLDEFYHRHALGSFTFDGSQGPDQSAAAIAQRQLGCRHATQTSYIDALADFLSGRVYTASIALGDPDRQVFVNTYDLFAEDAWQVTHKLNVNSVSAGTTKVRCTTVEEPLRFRPSLGGTGIAIQGEQIAACYDPVYTNFSPRVGASYQVNANTVVRARRGSLLRHSQPESRSSTIAPATVPPTAWKAIPRVPSSVHTTTVNGVTIQDGVDVFNSGTTPSQNSLVLGRTRTSFPRTT